MFQKCPCNILIVHIWSDNCYIKNLTPSLESHIVAFHVIQHTSMFNVYQNMTDFFDFISTNIIFIQILRSVFHPHHYGTHVMDVGV